MSLRGKKDLETNVPFLGVKDIIAKDITNIIASYRCGKLGNNTPL